MKFIIVLPLLLFIFGCSAEKNPSRQDEEMLERAIRNHVYPATIDIDSVEVSGCVIKFTNIRDNICYPEAKYRVLSESYRIDITDFSEKPNFMFVGRGNSTDESILTWMLIRSIKAEYDELRQSDTSNYNATELHENRYTEQLVQQGFRSVRIVNLCEAEPELNTFWPGAVSLIVSEDGEEIRNALRNYKQKFC